jgi:hypothetical protein
MFAALCEAADYYNWQVKLHATDGEIDGLAVKTAKSTFSAAATLDTLDAVSASVLAKAEAKI